MGSYYVNKCCHHFKDCTFTIIRNGEKHEFNDDSTITLIDQDQLIVYDAQGNKLEGVKLEVEKELIDCNECLHIKEDKQVNLVQTTNLEIQLETSYIDSSILVIKDEDYKYPIVFENDCYYQELCLMSKEYQLETNQYYDYYLDGILISEDMICLNHFHHSLRIVCRNQYSHIELISEQCVCGLITINKQEYGFILNEENNYYQDFYFMKDQIMSIEVNDYDIVVGNECLLDSTLCLIHDHYLIRFKQKQGSITLNLCKDCFQECLEVELCYENELITHSLIIDDQLILEHMPFGCYQLISDQPLMNDTFILNDQCLELTICLLDRIKLHVINETNETLRFYLKNDLSCQEIIVEDEKIIEDLMKGHYEIISDQDLQVNGLWISENPYLELEEDGCIIIKGEPKYSICFTSESWVDVFIDDHCFHFNDELVIYDMKQKVYLIKVNDDQEIIINDICYGNELSLQLTSDILINIQNKVIGYNVDIVLVQKDIKDEYIQKIDDKQEYEIKLNDQNYLLNYENNYRLQLLLEPGKYYLDTVFTSKIRINQQDSDHTFTISNEPLQIVIIKENNQAIIDLNLYTMMDQVMMIPQGSYELCLQDEKETYCFTLNEDNHYQVSIDQLPLNQYLVTIKNHSIFIAFNNQEFTSNHSIEVKEHYNQLNVLLCHAIKIKASQMNQPCMIVYENELEKVSYELNESNHYQITLKNNGQGMIKCGHQACFKYQDEKVKVVKVEANKDYELLVDAIPSGSLKLELFASVSNGLVKPQEQKYEVMITNKQNNYQYELNSENNYQLKIEHLPQDLYVVKVLNADVNYVINGKSVVDKAIIALNDELQSINIIQKAKKGSIVIKNETSDDLFIEMNYQTLINAYTILKHQEKVIKNLDQGDYCLRSKQKVQYLIDQKYVSDKAVVQVDHDDHEIVVTSKKQGVIHLTSYYENERGLSLGKTYDETIVVISNDEVSKQYRLNKDNKFNIAIDDLAYGMYEIKVLNDQNNVDILVDDQKQLLVVNEDYHYVKIIYKKKQKASLKIKKWIKNSLNQEMIPADGDEYVVELSSSEDVIKIILNGENQFEATLFDLKEGIYQIQELNNNDYQTTYRINGVLVQQASVVIHYQEEAFVELINERNDNLNTIEVFKYYLDANNRYMMPKEGSYQFLLKSSQVNEIYTLDETNNYHITISNQPSGTYQIEELNVKDNVRYFVNSNSLQNEAIFSINARESIVVAIINELKQEDITTLVIEKKLAQQEMLQSLSFIIEISNESFSERYVLSRDNNYVLRVDLSYGTYQVKELKENNVRFVLDGKIVNDKMILDQKQQYLEVINRVHKTTITMEL